MVTGSGEECCPAGRGSDGEAGNNGNGPGQNVLWPGDAPRPGPGDGVRTVGVGVLQPPTGAVGARLPPCSRANSARVRTPSWLASSASKTAAVHAAAAVVAAALAAAAAAEATAAAPPGGPCGPPQAATGELGTGVEAPLCRNCCALHGCGGCRCGVDGLDTLCASSCGDCWKVATGCCDCCGRSSCACTSTTWVIIFCAKRFTCGGRVGGGDVILRGSS